MLAKSSVKDPPVTPLPDNQQTAKARSSPSKPRPAGWTAKSRSKATSAKPKPSAATGTSGKDPPPQPPSQVAVTQTSVPSPIIPENPLSVRRKPFRSLSSGDISVTDELLATHGTRPTKAYTVKLSLAGDTRRLKLPDKTIHETLQSVKRCFGLLPSQFSMCYKDDEGDVVAVYQDQELCEAFDVAAKQQQVLKLFIKPVLPQDSSASFSLSNSSASSQSSQDQGHRSTVTHNYGRSFYSSSASASSPSGSGGASEARRTERKQWREKRLDVRGKRHPLSKESNPGHRTPVNGDDTSSPPENPSAPPRPASVAGSVDKDKEAPRKKENNSGSSVEADSGSGLARESSGSSGSTRSNGSEMVTNTGTDMSSISASAWSGAWVSRTYKAKFIKDVNLLDRSQVPAGQTRMKTWQLKNSGNVPWPRGTGVKLFRSCTYTDSNLEHPCQIVDPNSRFPVEAATPGQIVDVSVIFTTPPGSGRCRAFFRLITDENQFFGPRMWLDINVVPQNREAAEEEPVDAEANPDCEEVARQALCEEFEVLRCSTDEEALQEDEIFLSNSSASNSGSKAGSEGSDERSSGGERSGGGIGTGTSSASNSDRDDRDGSYG